jgi:hypothetical protein
VKDRTQIHRHLLAVPFVKKQRAIQLGYVLPSLILIGKQPRWFAYNEIQESCCRDVLYEAAAREFLAHGSSGSADERGAALHFAESHEKLALH